MSGNILFLIVLFPLLGAFINGFVLPLVFKGFGKAPLGLVVSIALGAILCSFCLGVTAFYQLSTHSLGEFIAYSYDWFKFGGLSIPFELRLDSLNSMLVLIITGVGSLIHLYSASYMHHDPGYGKYFSYLNLFCFAMLLLVMGNNLVLLFFGWEGVGLCSYLLIGFWYTDTEKANAGKKAFVVNRIGDLGFLVGIFLIFRELGTVSFSEIDALWSDPDVLLGLQKIATWIAIALFIGACGKSAQIPLYVWLPDAMSGPTPVSALIHAATMVTAGVYMIVRLYPLFELSQTALMVIAHTGAITALFAGTIAIAQTDIKKVLAYSTVSQLGFMFLACGVGAFQTAVFHLMTHAFFKALLFLGSGSVIHACSGEQDMRKMGGLKKYLPHTHATMLIGSLAISGIPFFSGFFSKDEILYSALALPNGFPHLFWIGVLTAFLTAVYTGRMMSLTFYGKDRLEEEVKHHIHESPFAMLFPLYCLAFLAAFGGFLGVPHILGNILGHMPHFLSLWLDSVAPTRELPLVVSLWPMALSEVQVMVGSSIVAISGFSLGIVLFKEKFFISDYIPGFKSLHKVLQNKYYVDEFYDLICVSPLQKISRFCAQIFDPGLIDKSVNVLATSTKTCGEKIRLLQTGDIQVYAILISLGVIIMGMMIY